MTYARLEIPLQDIDGTNRLPLANWLALCEKWSFGLRGLRLTIVHLPNVMATSSGPDSGGVGKGEPSLAAICPAPGSGVQVTVEDPATSDYPWIDAGLRKLEALRRLEVELKTTLLSDNEKLDWCEGLRGRLSRRLGGVGGGEGRGEDVHVVCVRAKVN